MRTIYNKEILTYILSVCLIMIITSCEERIDINTEASDPHLVIYGYLSTDTAIHTIRITRSTGYFVTTKPESISDAIVTIQEEGGEKYTLEESDLEPGLYLTKGYVAGKPGKTYTLSVSVDFDDDGIQEEYEATSFLPLPATVDSIGYRDSEVFTDFVEILLWGNMPESDENYLSIQFMLNDLESSLEDYVLLDDEYIGKKEIIGVPCYYHDLEDLELQDGDLITLQVDAITKDYFTFIGSAQDELYGNNPIFSGPPANVKTNIKSKDPSNNIPISGFFTALSRDKSTVIYKK